MASEIVQGKIGAVSTVDDKYYLLKWTNLPYRIEGDQFLTEYDPPIHVKDGELVCEGQYLEELLRAIKWYYPTDIKTVVRLQQFLAANIEMNPIAACRTIYYHGVAGHSENPNRQAWKETSSTDVFHTKVKQNVT